MKLVVAIIQAYDSDRLLRAVTDAGLRATKIVSTGGFLRMANTTVLMGVEDEQVDDCLQLIRNNCESRAETPPDASEHEYIEWLPIGVQEVTVGGAVVFILRVSDFRQMYPANDASRSPN